MKKTKIIVSVLVLILISASVYVLISAISPAKQLGIDSTKAEDLPKELAIVGDTSITSKDVEEYRYCIKLQEIYIDMVDSDHIIEPMTDEEILEHLIENEVLYLEAEKQGLIVTDDEVSEYVDFMKTYYAENEDDEMIALVREYASGKGMTLNEYLDMYKPFYKKSFSIGRLRGIYVGEITSYDERIAKWDQVKADLVEQYQSEIAIK